MNESERLAGELDKALHGGAWHGPSFMEALRDVDWKTAVRRPIPDAHSIAEIVLHAAVWHEVVRRRLEGENPQVSDDQDWPVVPFDGESSWRAAIDRADETGRALCEKVHAFPAEQLHEPRPRIDDTWYGLISGELQHVIYHAGQIAVLKKAGAGR